MPESTRIALSQLVLWYDASRIQTWPSFLARVPRELLLPSPTEFGRRFATERMTDTRHAAAEKLTRNLPGLEYRGERLCLRGLGLLEKVGRQYRLSAQGRTLADAYVASPNGDDWPRLLAELLLQREPRTRILVSNLSEPGAVLSFPDGGWFTGSVRSAIIERQGQPAMKPFSDRRDDVATLADALAARPFWALGQWREDPLLRDVTDCQLTGQTSSEVSLHDVGLALHAACEVLLHVGLLRPDAEVWTLDQEAGRRTFSPAIADEFGWRFTVGAGKAITDVLGEILTELRSPTGYVVASELRARLKDAGIDDPDSSIAELERAGRLVVTSEDYGQSRHGRGLYDDPRKQLVKIRLTTEEPRA